MGHTYDIEKRERMACQGLKKYIVFVLVWILALLCVYRPARQEAPAYAWWGSMYPEYCFSENAKEDLPVKISFRWLRIK